jgi:hypothetical protein
MEIVSETSDSDGKLGEAALLSFALKVERMKAKAGSNAKLTWLQSTGGGGAGSVEVRTTLTCIVEEA